jgi:hypothetical protein
LRGESLKSHRVSVELTHRLGSKQFTATIATDSGKKENDERNQHELLAAQAETWTAATAYAALLHDAGKIAVDLHAEHADGSMWHPWHGPLARPYRFGFRTGRKHRLHESATGLMYAYTLGQTILDWLSGFPELWESLLYALAGHYEHAGILGELVTQADRASVAQTLGGDPTRARADPPQQSLQRRLLEGLRLLVRDRFKLNQPQASDGWLTEDALWLVSKTACDKLRAHLLSHGIAGVPEKNTASVLRAGCNNTSAPIG